MFTVRAISESVDMEFINQSLSTVVVSVVVHGAAAPVPVKPFTTSITVLWSTPANEIPPTTPRSIVPLYVTTILCVPLVGFFKYHISEVKKRDAAGPSCLFASVKFSVPFQVIPVIVTNAAPVELRIPDVTNRPPLLIEPIVKDNVIEETEVVSGETALLSKEIAIP